MKFHYQANVWAMLRQNVSKGQLLGYVISNIVGLIVILVGIQFYADSQTQNTEADKFLSSDYVVLSKRVDGIGFAPLSFSEEEIADLNNQAWVKKVGRFTASRFAVSGAVSMGGKTLSTYLFFESVPDEFFDVKPDGWTFSPDKKYVPIVMSKDYLTLYNFGFAIPQGLPQVSEEIISTVPITLRLTGQDMETENFDARIVGFSQRLNTITVPQSFMDWANAHYATKETGSVSRLIVETDGLKADAMRSYLQAHDLEMAGDNEKAGNISQFLGIVSAVVTSNGVVICTLAVFILVLSIFLLFQKSREKLRCLMLLGYHPLYVAHYYRRLVIVCNIAVTLVAVVVTLLARLTWADGLADIGLGGASVFPMLSCAACYAIGITLFDVYIIRRQLLSIWQ